MSELSQLANAGLAGVSIALIIALVIIVKAVLKLIGNHMNHNTASNVDLAAAIRSLMEMINRRIK